MQRRAPFLLFAAVAAVHLAAIAADATWLERPTKLLLMPALLAAVVLSVLLDRRAWSSRRGVAGVLLIGAAVTASWAGDALLDEPGTLGFVIGLGSFAVAHLVYIAAFVGPLRTRRLPWWAAGALVWLVVLVVVLAPVLGVLLLPVVVYGVVLASTAATATATNPVTAIGALLFLTSDTVLAFRMFWPDFAWSQASLVIMLTYCAGQGLIAFGAIGQLTRAADSGSVSRLP